MGEPEEFPPDHEVFGAAEPDIDGFGVEQASNRAGDGGGDGGGSGAPPTWTSAPAPQQQVPAAAPRPAAPTPRPAGCTPRPAAPRQQVPASCT
jgi:hypothetical protein